MNIKLLSSKDNDNKKSMYSKKSNYIETMIANESDEIIEKLFQSLLTIYQWKKWFCLQ